MKEVKVTRLNTLRSMGREKAVVAPNYAPLPVVLAKGEGVWVEDVEGKRFLDALAGYSAVNFGHSNPRLTEVANEQMKRLTMVSRAFHSDQLEPFCAALADLAGASMVLPMNTGAEAVETAIKAARRWGYEVKGVAEDQAQIIVMSSNFHGRTTTIVSFSDDAEARKSFGPYTPGFTVVPFGNLDAVKEAAGANTVAVLTEVIQGEAGVVVPPPDFLPDLRKFCTDNDILLVVDEIQSGLGRTGATFACDLYDVSPDLMTLGKALGGGILPVSAVVGRADVLSQLSPGSHGSTFGGNPLAAAIGLEVIKMIREGTYQESARASGEQLGKCLEQLAEDFPDRVKGFSRVGLWAGLEINEDFGTGRQLSEKLLEHGVLTKEAQGTILRFSPPLSITEEEMGFLCSALRSAISGESED